MEPRKTAPGAAQNPAEVTFAFEVRRLKIAGPPLGAIEHTYTLRWDVARGAAVILGDGPFQELEDVELAEFLATANRLRLAQRPNAVWLRFLPFGLDVLRIDDPFAATFVPLYGADNFGIFGQAYDEKTFTQALRSLAESIRT